MHTNAHRCDRDKRRRPHFPKSVEGIPIPVGPGGTLCPCCFPAPGSARRRVLMKAARRVAKARDMREQIEFAQDD